MIASMFWNSVANELALNFVRGGNEPRRVAGASWFFSTTGILWPVIFRHDAHFADAGSAAGAEM